MVLRESRAAGQVKRGAIDRRVPSASIPFPTRALGARARPPTTGSEEMEESDAVGGVAVQLIDGEGEFAAEGAERFMAAAGVAGCGLSYAVVSIMGPQSSGTVRTASIPIPSALHDDRSRLVGPPITSSIGGPAPCARAGHLFDEMLVIMRVRVGLARVRHHLRAMVSCESVVLCCLLFLTNGRLS